jgi:hypothetical protein
MGFFDLSAEYNQQRPDIPRLPTEKCKTSIAKALCLASNASNKIEASFPELSSILARSKTPHNDWCFFFVAAGLYTASSHPYCTDQLREEMLNDAKQIDAQMPVALDDLCDFIDKKAEESSDPLALIGLWVLWNIGGGMPGHDECKMLAPAIGSFLRKVVSDCFLAE